MRTPRSRSVRARAVVTEMCGTNTLPGSLVTEPSTRTLYTKVATNTPSVICVPRSRMKLRSIRGPNCVEARVRARMVTEKTTPATVMMAAAIAVRIVREASAPPVFTQDGTSSSPASSLRSRR
jgi:hypothetical protein